MSGICHGNLESLKGNPIIGFGNCNMAKLARKEISGILQRIEFLIASVGLSIIQLFYVETQSRKQQKNMYRIAKLGWTYFERNRTILLLSLNIRSIHRTFAVEAGRCRFGRHEKRFSISSNDY